MKHTTDKKILYLIDGSAYIHRAYHAISGLSNSEGLPTNAIFGFTNMLIKLKESKAPDYWGVSFDVKGPTFRHKIYSDYKANRPAMKEDLIVQIPYIKDVSDALNISIAEREGYEADDIIGSLKTVAEALGFFVVMVTSDKDFLQLITEKTSIWDPMKEKLIDLKAIKDTYGIAPLQFIDMMALTGDISDNVPGIAGIGPKTALVLIKEYGSLENLYDNLDLLSKKKLADKLAKYRDIAFLSKELVTIKTDIDMLFKVEDFKYKEPDKDKVIKLFNKFEFKKLLQTYISKPDYSKKKYKTVLTKAELKEIVALLKGSDLFAIDTETTSASPINAKLVGISFSVKEDEAYYIPVGHDYKGATKQLDLQEVLEVLKPVLEAYNIKKVGQNIKYDMIVFLRYGIELKGVVFDTMIASYLINPSERSHSLENIAVKFLNCKMMSFKEAAGTGAGALFSKADIGKASVYACEDADITFSAYKFLMPLIKKEGFDKLFYNIEMLLIPILMKMEMAGICVDVQRLQGLSETLEKRLNDLTEKIYECAEEEFNINSSQQLGEIFFEKLNLPVQKKTKKTKNYSTDVDVLKILSMFHPLPAFVLEHRTLAKLKSTYADALITIINPETKRIHTSFNQSITATGRISSSSPNLQNIPIRTEEGKKIRKAFIPKPGWELLSADYSQIELRILAHYSDDFILTQAFKNDEDIHTRTAVEIFNVFSELVTEELRRAAKAVNFGIIYGMSPYGLSRELGITQKTAKVYIDSYFKKYEGVSNFIEKIIEEARKIQKVSTLLGRIRRLPDINSANLHLRRFAERTAVNTPIQGTAADFIKIAMIKVSDMLLKENLKTSMLLTVHDELIFEVPPEEIKTASVLIKEAMENIAVLKVPLKVNIKKGKSWADAL
ncbi:MAG: DNA polymerase I [Deltaproteobacteria bacterium]|nr:DNA polymerase I [Deltaproteobacteria bacterium]